MTYRQFAGAVWLALLIFGSLVALFAASGDTVWRAICKMLVIVSLSAGYTVGIAFGVWLLTCEPVPSPNKKPEDCP